MSVSESIGNTINKMTACPRNDYIHLSFPNQKEKKLYLIYNYLINVFLDSNTPNDQNQFYTWFNYMC